MGLSKREKEISIKFRNSYYIAPPGSATEILSHPKNKYSGAIDLAIFQEHRYAFFYWLKWTRESERSEPPCMISLDWHQDLCFPDEVEKDWLSKLDQSNDGEVAAFSWAKLAGNNDGHILCAAYLNLIGDIYIHCRQEPFFDSWKDEELIDIYGNKHIIKKFKTFDSLEQHMLTSKETQVYFDIDLDFFVLDSPLNNENKKKFSYMTKKQIHDILSINRPLIDWILERLSGFTIATEPKHCGGILKSNRFLSIISKLYFEPEIFAPNCDWKHKRS